MKKLFVFLGFAGLLSAVLADDFTLDSKFSNSKIPERLLSFSAAWNSNSRDADFARGCKLAAGCGNKIDSDGSILITEIGGQLLFRGENNINPESGTVRFKVKGSVWKKGVAMTLFSASRESYFLDIVKRKDRLSLTVRVPKVLTGKADKVEDFRRVSEVSVPLDAVRQDKWYTITASWNIFKQQGMISIDGKAVSGKLAIPRTDMRGYLLFLVGSSVKAKDSRDGLAIKGVSFDDLEIARYDYFEVVRMMKMPPAEDILVKAENGVGLTLSTLAKLRRMDAGWQNVYTYPNFLGAEAQGRDLLQYDNIITNDKSRGSAYVAAQYAYAYELLNDYHYLDIALKTADFYVRAQSPEGAWLYLYKVGAGTISCGSAKPEYKFQDSCQSHPLYLLAYVYRLTGNKTYFNAMKKSGEFYLSAQNPDGSWSHHYDHIKKVGRTCRGLPNGGEINDRAMNDAIDVMTLMYHVTKDKKYISALKRAGEFLLKSQINNGKVCGWADQYDKDMKPIWARKFEPPSVSREGTLYACEALVTLYRMSGDQRFKTALLNAEKWFKKISVNGKCFNNYDIETGSPIAARMDKIYFLDDPQDAAKFASFSRGKLPAPDFRIPDFNKFKKEMVYPVVEKDISDSELDKMLKLTEKLGKMATGTQNKDGLWVYPRYADKVYSVGAGFIPGQGRLFMMLRYIDVLKMRRGEIERRYRGGIYPHGEGEMRTFAKPVKWFDVPWN
ncbi:MAG: pectate lyase [Lentisphaeria bacterium]|nr:pectate lyase [Lentisphaeria bacterium]